MNSRIGAEGKGTTMRRRLLGHVGRKGLTASAALLAGLSACIAVLAALAIVPALAATEDFELSLQLGSYSEKTLDGAFLSDGELQARGTVTDLKADEREEALQVWANLTSGSADLRYEFGTEEENEGVYTLEDSLHLDDGTWNLEVVAGDEGLYSASFTVDTTQPVIKKLEMDDPDRSNWFWGDSYYDTAKLNFTIDEANIDTITVSAKVDGKTKTWNVLPTTSTSYTFSDEGDYSDIKLTVQDKLGNAASKSIGNEFTIEKTVVSSKLSVKDSSTTYTYANLTDSSVDYLDTSTPEIVLAYRGLDTSKTTISVLDTSGNTTVYGGSDGKELEWTPNKKDKSYSTKSLRLDDGAYAVTISVATSYSSKTQAFEFGWTEGDTTTDPVTEPTVSGTFVIDSKAPVISDIVWGTSEAADPTPKNDKYYNADRTATITVTEANFDASRMSVDTSGTTGSWTQVEGTNKYTMTVTFSNDGEHNLRVYGKDKAGNEAVSESNPKQKYVEADAFVIDKTAPVVSDIVWDNTSAKHDKYYAASRTATVTITEANFDESKADDWIIYADGSDTAKSITWKHAGSSHVAMLVFADDGSYEFSVKGTDLAGNESNTVESGAFVVDTTAPVVKEIEWDQDYETYSGTKYFKEVPTATITVVELNFDSSLFTVDTTGKVGTWSDDGDTHVLTVTFDDEGGQSIAISGEDLAGNASNEQDEDFVIDLTAPEITKVSVNKEPASTAADDSYFFYNKAATMTINVKDDNPIAYANYTFEGSGVTTDENHVIDGDDTYTAQLDVKDNTASVTIALEEGSGAEAHKVKEFERNVILTVWDVAGNMRTWSISPKGKVVDANSSSPANTSINGKNVYPTNLVQDTTAPKVSVTGVTAGTFYNSNQTANLTVAEYNFSYLQRFDGGRTIMTVNKQEGNASRAKSTTTITAKQLRGSDPNYSYSYLFDSDGHYTIEAAFKDYATNQSNKVTIAEFTVDKTDPVIEVRWDNNDVRNGKYYNAGRTATITVTEHNFDPSLFKIETTGATSGWSNNGDTHTMTVSCTEDGGVYALKVSGADQAGNKAIDYTEDEFVIDMSAPEITFGGPFGDHELVKADDVDGELVVSDATNGVAEPIITYSDKPDTKGGEPFEYIDTEYELTRLDGESADLVVNPNPDNGVSGGVYHVAFSDFGKLSEPDEMGMEYDLEADGVYKLTAHMSDLAGNEADNAILFSVNRYGTTFVIESVYTDEAEVKEHSDEARNGVVWLGEEPSILVRAIDVSENTEHYVTVERPDAKTPTIAEVDARNVANVSNDAYEGYVFKVVNDGSKGWYEYTYRIGSENFGDGHGGEGAYTVTISDGDTAGNTSTAESFYDRETNGALSTAQVAFFLDSIGPEVQIIEPSWVEIGGTYDLQFQVIDEQKLTDERISLAIDGVELSEEAVQALRDNGSLVGPDSVGNYTLTLDHKTIFNKRSVEIVATDWIDRTGSASTDAFRVTNLVAEILGGIALIGGGTAGVVLYQRKRKAGKSDSPYAN